jgi:peptidoglycan/xylan/chitin deacetylase (PgdA/CDA1 family)
VDPERFAEHLEVIAGRFQPISLRDLAAAVDCGAIPQQSVCVTFDDGYRDNLYVAKPLLERYEVPATVFVVSGYVDSGRDFWWDELERLCLDGALPRQISIELEDGAFEWSGSGAATQPMPSWRAWSRPRTERQELYILLYERLIVFADRERRAALELLASLIDTGRRDVLTSTAREIKRLGDADLVEIGAHTVTHPRLSFLPVGMQREEITGCKRQLEHLLERQIESFAYPHSDYGGEAIAQARAADYSRACGGRTPGAVSTNSSIFDIPRVPVQNWSASEMAGRLSRYLRR